MKNKISVISFWVLVAVAIIYLAVSIVPSIFSSEEIFVKPAESIVYDDSITVSGIALRDEVIVSASSDPASIDYKVSDGDRVSIGYTVATYSNQNSSNVDRLSVDMIDRQVNLLNDCLSATTQFDLKTIDSRTKDAIREHLSASSQGNLTDALDSASSVQSCFIKRDIKTTGDKSYYRQILKNCEASRNTILTGDSAKQMAVTAGQAGYFSSVYDGYESLKASQYSAATPETVNQLLSETPQQRPKNYIGKLQHFSYWTYLCNLPVAEAQRFEVGTSWMLRFETALYGTKTVSMTVVRISEPVEGQVAVSFESSFFDEAIYSLRITDAQIILQSYTGFRVDRDAIRVYNGDTGVYVLSGAKLVFKPVSILYRNEERGFVVVTPDTKSPSRALILNDAVVIGGKDVYDGKVVNIN